MSLKSSSSHRDYSPSTSESSPPSWSGSSKSTDTSPSSDFSTNPGSSKELPPKRSNQTILPRTVNVSRGKDPPAKDYDNFDGFSYEFADDKDYNSYNFSEKYKKKVGQYIVELRQSGRSGEGFAQ